MKRIIRALLAALLLLPCLAPASAAAGTDSTVYPTVYLHGQGGSLYAKDENGQEIRIYKPEIDSDALWEQINTLHRPFAKGVTTGDWGDWCDTFCGIVCPILKPIALGTNGLPQDNSYVHDSTPRKKIANADGTYNINTYDMNYDWRLDPWDIADSLNTYITKLKQVTGAPMVNLFGRCLGANVALAYLAKYGTADINDVVLYCCSFSGFELAGRCFTGRLNFDGDALYRFSDDALRKKQPEDEELYGLLCDLLYFLYLGGTVGTTAWTVQQVYDEVYQNVVPRILKDSFGTMPSFWNLVPNKYLEEAERFVIGDDTEEYTDLLARVHRYRDKVYNRTEEIIQNAEQTGTDVYIIAKYGLQMMPVTEDDTIQSDAYLELRSASFGAACAPVNGAFNEAYITAAKEAGTAKYISCDRQVDASTALLPDHTWFIKGLNHMDMPDCVNTVVASLINHSGKMTVFDDPNLPQYLVYENDTISPLTVPAEDDPGYSLRERFRNFFGHIGSFFRHIFTLLRDSLHKVFNKADEPDTIR